MGHTCTHIMLMWKLHYLRVSVLLGSLTCKRDAARPPAPRPISVYNCPLLEIYDIKRNSAQNPSFGIKYRKVYQLLRLIMQPQSAGDPVKYKYFVCYVRLKQTPSTLSLSNLLIPLFPIPPSRLLVSLIIRHCVIK
jgi:hypothetical protein